MNPRKDINKRYSETMKSVRNQMGVIGKISSIILHFPPIEILLSLMDRTILRPIPLLFSGIAAFLGGLGLYSISLYNGYQMNDAVIPLLLIGGLLVGVVFDYLQIFFNGTD